MSDIVKILMGKVDAAIAPLLGNVKISKIVLADIPNHPNVGDDAITLGELAFLRKQYLSAEISGFPRKLYNPDIYPLLEEADVIFLHGGGNFGDIWPLHHALRLDLMKTFPHKKVIQFPQSIHFDDDSVLENTKTVINAMSDFTLLVRDLKSLEFARREFECNIILCPDMAFSMGKLAVPVATLDYSCLLRTDKEVLEKKILKIETALKTVGASFEINDWLENRFLEKRYLNLWKVACSLMPATVLAKKGMPLLELYARARLEHGVKLLGKGKIVITDRLHGYIISTLLGRRRYVFDSSDGKIRAFHEAWLSAEKDAVFLNSTDELKLKLSLIKSGGAV